jgi:prolyl oligopeptidase
MTTANEPALVPPATRRDEIVETIHGVAVNDPYRWLEDGASPEVRAWTAAQNARTEALLAAVPGRPTLEARLTELFRAGSLGAPERRGRRIFYTRREGDQAQAVLCWRDGLDGEERVLIDPNRLDERGLTALDWWHPSHDGARVAYGTSHNGDEWSTLRVIDVESGEVLPDAIGRTRYCSVGWLPGNDAFVYTRYPKPGSVPPGQENYNRHTFLHRLGQDPTADEEVFGAGRAPEDMIAVATSPDGRWLVVTVSIGWIRTDVYVRDLHAADSGFQTVAEGLDAIFDSPRFAAGRLLLRTNLDAPRYRIVSVDPTSPQSAWLTLVPEREEGVIEGFELAGGRIVTSQLDRAFSHLGVYRLDGTAERSLELPGLGSVYELAGAPDERHVVVCYSSFTAPPCLLAFDLENGARLSFAPLEPVTGLDAAAIEIEQVHYPSKDGTLVSMFLCHQRGLVRNGDTPTVLTAYGGFNIPKRSEWQAPLPAWIERGGLVAVPNLRGGGEYGEEWHRAGMLDRKQNVFDDFIAAAEWLIAEGFTRPNRLAIRGGSNGGLLVGAVTTQRPDLFRAAVCMVPLLDMVRYHRFSVARLWIPEYGSAEDPEAFRWLHAYSPYHRVRPGVAYPATLLTAAEQDSRVDPLHARKMAALLQWATADHTGSNDRPILLRLESEAGHGIGKPIWKRVAEAADEGSFLAWQLGVDLG